MVKYKRNGEPDYLIEPCRDNSTFALKSDHSRGKDKKRRLDDYHEKEYGRKQVGLTLCTVTVHDLALDVIKTYRIVDGDHSELASNKIAHNSPLGSALYNSRRQVGSIVKVDAPEPYDVRILKAK